MTTHTRWVLAFAVVAATAGSANSPQKDVPQAFVDAANRLFERGMSDPARGEYRSATAIVDKWKTDVVGWVSPAYEGGPRTVVCWDGLSYKVEEARETRDLAADVRAGIAALRSPWPSAGLTRPRSAISVALLVRVGRADLAGEVFEALQLDQGRRAAERSVEKLHLDAATKRYARAVQAFRKGDFASASADADWIVEHSELLGVEAVRLAVGRGPSAQALYIDAVRRLGSPAQPEAKVEKADDLPPTLRAKALIRKLDTVRTTLGIRSSWVTKDPVMEALIELGDAAVDPLIDRLEGDDRLTKSTYVDGPRCPPRIATAREVAAAIVLQVLRVSQWPRDDNGMPKGADLRAYWRKMRDLPFMERQYRMLADDTATPQQWREAASRIVAGPLVFAISSSGRVTPFAPDEPTGEVLRSKTDPSVTELLGRRATSLLPARGEVGMSVLPLEIALHLVEWDPVGGAKALNAIVESAEFSILKLQRQSIKVEMEARLKHLKQVMEKAGRPGSG